MVNDNPTPDSSSDRPATSGRTTSRVLILLAFAGAAAAVVWLLTALT